MYEGYRNKCEFTIGLGLDAIGKTNLVRTIYKFIDTIHISMMIVKISFVFLTEKTVGFRLAAYKGIFNILN